MYTTPLRWCILESHHPILWFVSFALTKAAFVLTVRGACRTNLTSRLLSLTKLYSDRLSNYVTLSWDSWALKQTRPNWSETTLANIKSVSMTSHLQFFVCSIEISKTKGFKDCQLKNRFFEITFFLTSSFLSLCVGLHWI